MTTLGNIRTWVSELYQMLPLGQTWQFVRQTVSWLFVFDIIEYLILFICSLLCWCYNDDPADDKESRCHGLSIIAAFVKKYFPDTANKRQLETGSDPGPGLPTKKQAVARPVHDEIVQNGGELSLPPSTEKTVINPVTDVFNGNVPDDGSGDDIDKEEEEEQEDTCPFTPQPSPETGGGGLAGVTVPAVKSAVTESSADHPPPSIPPSNKGDSSSVKRT